MALGEKDTTSFDSTGGTAPVEARLRQILMVNDRDRDHDRDRDETHRREPTATSSCEPAWCAFALSALLRESLRAREPEVGGTERDANDGLEERVHAFMQACCALDFEDRELYEAAVNMMVSVVRSRASPRPRQFVPIQLPLALLSH